MSTLFEYLKASKDTIKNLFSKPNTVLYPYDHVPIPEGFRGAPAMDEPEKCLLCQKCVRICPTQALSIIDVDETHSIFEINLGRCCYCKECEDSCTFDAIKLTTDLNTAGLDKESLIRTIEVPKRVKKKTKPTE